MIGLEYDSDVVLNGRFYYQGKFQDLSVSVSQGIITRIGKFLKAERIVHLPHAVLPASTDTHVHFRDPGETDKEDFRSGTTSAIYGGTTTVFDMPNNRVPVTDYEVFESKLSAISGKAYADFGLYSLFTGSNKDLLDKRTSGLKIFMGGSTNAAAIGDPDMVATDFLRNYENPVVFHAEDASCLSAHSMEEHDCRDHNMARPIECEQKAIEKAVSFRLKKGVIAHLSFPYDIQTNYLFEVTPHHLLLNDESVNDQWGKVNPPLRDRGTQEKLLALFLAGKFSLLTSDHAPHSYENKEDFEHAASGIIGVETRIPLMLSLVKRKILSMDLFLKTACSNPAALFGLRKGMLQVGYSADFMCVDFSSEKPIDQDRLHSKVTVTPFNGYSAIFPSDVVMRGETVLEKYELIEDHLGRFISNDRK